MHHHHHFHHHHHDHDKVNDSQLEVGLNAYQNEINQNQSYIQRDENPVPPSIPQNRLMTESPLVRGRQESLVESTPTSMVQLPVNPNNKANEVQTWSGNIQVTDLRRSIPVGYEVPIGTSEGYKDESFILDNNGQSLGTEKFEL